MKMNFNLISSSFHEKSIGSIQRLTLIIIFIFNCSVILAQNPTANFSASTTQGCVPLQVSFTNNSSGASNYQWIFGDGNTSTIQHPSNIFITAGTYNVKLVASNNTGLSDTFSVNITVHPKPVASFTASSFSACVNNNQFTFNNTSTGAVSYFWDFGDGVTSTDQNPVHTYSMHGIYSIKLIAYNSYGCSDIIEKQNHITIHQKPDAAFSSNITYACNTTHPFIFTPVQSGNTYLWNFGDGNMSTASTPSHTYTTPGSYNVSLIATNSTGCKDTVVKNNYITIGNNIPSVVSANTTSGCPPLNVSLTTNTPGMVAAYFDFGNGIQVSSTHTYTSAGSYNVTITEIDDKLCAHVTQLNNYITVHTPPQVAYTTSDTLGCTPYDVNFLNSSTNAISYEWDFGDNTSPDTNLNPLHTYFNEGNYNVTLKGISANGCESSFTLPTAINVITPVANFSSNITTGCAPLTVDFIDKSLYASQWFWDFGDGTTSTLMNPVKTYAQAGNYNVSLTITSVNGCTETITFNSYIKVLDPYADYVTPTVKTGCVPFTVSFTDNTAGNSNVLWDFGDGTTSNATHPTHTYNIPGIYTVSLTVQTLNGCTFNIPNYQTIEVKGAEADFSVVYTSCPPYISSFTDSSSNAVSWLWNFGDGNTSTLQNPTHNYGGYGNYNVSLTITTSDGCTHTKLVVNAVVFEQLSANFSWTSLNSGFPMTIEFMANSVGATSWLWDFGDGGTSTLENPVYTYQQPGQYTVTLTVSNNNCSITYVMSSSTFGSGAGGMDPGPGPGPAPQPATGCVPFTTHFVDPTNNAIAWLWDLGDGNISTLQNPVHTYFQPGKYDVTLTITKNNLSTATIIMPELVNVSGPIAAFNVTTGTNCSATVANVTDQSINAVQWNWDFGDGNTSTSQNPVHTYQSTLNNYTISLTAVDTLGCTNQLFKNINSGLSQSITADKYSVCKGDTVNFQTSLSGYSFYIWDFGDGNIAFGPQQSHIYNHHGNYQVTLIVYSSSGCTFNYYLPINISVNGPVASFVVNSATEGCNSLAVSFENTSNNYVTAQWFFGDGTTSTLNTVSHNYGPGLYDVTLVAGSNGCYDTIVEKALVKVNNPIAQFTLNQIDICLPSTVQFFDASTSASAWYWDFGDGNFSMQQNPVHTYATASSNEITLMIMDSSGCVSTYSQPAVTFISGNFTANITTDCAPATVTFTSTTNNAATVTWLFGDGNSSNLLNPTHTYLSAGSYDVTLIITSANGCSDTITKKALINITQPVADFTHTINSNCIPAIVNFNDLSQNAVSWFWDFGDGTNSSSKNPSKIYNTPGHYTVSLIVTNNKGCQDTIIKNSLINVSGPLTEFNFNTTTICLPVTASFTDLSTNAVSWLWNFGDGNIDSTQNPVHVYSDTGVFTVTLISTDTAGCSAVYSMPASIEVRPVAKALFATNDTSGCTPYNVSLINSSSDANIFTWSFGDGNTSSQATPAHVYYQSGLYDVQLIASNQYGCSDTLTINDLIDVVETPSAEFNSNVISGCSPLEVQFIDLSTNLQNPSWMWDLGSGQIFNVQNPLDVFTSPGTYTVSLTVVNDGRCSSSVTKPAYITVHDLIPPAESPIHAVSVKSDSEIEITYGYVMDLDLLSYNVYRKNLVTGFYDLVNTQYNINSTSFSWDTTIVDNNLITNNNVYTYKIQTVDICGNSIPLDSLKEYNTINISTTTQNTGVQVTWNEYGGCNVNSYNLYRNKINQLPQLIATLPAGSTQYFDNEILCPEQFTYRIEATGLCNLNYNSYSDTSNALVPNLLSNQKVDVSRSTVVDDNSVLTEWTEPVLAPDKVSYYNLYRSENNSSYQLVATLPAQITSYLDYNTEVDLKRYIYSVEVVNVCNLAGAPSNIGNTILLNANVVDGKMILNWNGYIGWDNGVSNYKIERMEDSGWWVEIGDVDGDTRTFTD